MSLRLALLISLILHAVLLIAPSWHATRQLPSLPRIEARLLPIEDTQPAAEELSTSPVAPPPRDAVPHRLQGAALRQAQAELTRHLFYPPEAVSLGLEGEVILLLTMREDGRLLSADVARGSGHQLLDQAALDAARHIGSLPGTRRQLLFPVSFRLR